MVSFDLLKTSTTLILLTQKAIHHYLCIFLWRICPGRAGLFLGLWRSAYLNLSSRMGFEGPGAQPSYNDESAENYPVNAITVQLRRAFVTRFGGTQPPCRNCCCNHGIPPSLTSDTASCRHIVNHRPHVVLSPAADK